MEPEIIVNGSKLTDAQVITLRVACTQFAIDLANHGLGEDEHGRRMTQLYLRCLQEIQTLMLR